MATPKDKLCQWCKKTIAVGLADGSWMVVARNIEFQERYYCHEESGDCWTNLMALTKYVRDNFHA